MSVGNHSVGAIFSALQDDNELTSTAGYSEDLQLV